VRSGPWPPGPAPVPSKTSLVAFASFSAACACSAAVLAVGVCAAIEAAAEVRVGAAAKPASKLRRESALDVSGTVPPSGYRCDFGELSKIIEPAPLPNLLRLLTVPNSASLRQSGHSRRKEPNQTSRSRPLHPRKPTFAHDIAESECIKPGVLQNLPRFIYPSAPRR
jgi:hypothetical protein